MSAPLPTSRTRSAAEEGPPAARRGSLLGQLARGERTAAICFAGQGAPVLDELGHLQKQSATVRAWLEVMEGRLQRWWEERELRWSGLYPSPPRIRRWIEDPASRPEAGFLQSTQLTNPLIFLTQVLRYQALYEEGLGEALAGIPVLVGHSQGLMPSLLIAESPGGSISLERALAYLDYMVWQGLTMARCYHDPAAGAPMAAVSGPSLELLGELIAEVNAGLSGDALTLTLENTRTRGVVSGRPAHLRRLRELLEARGSEQVALRKLGRHGGKILTHTWEDLAVGGPFHSPYMAPGLDQMRAAVAALGFRVEARDLLREVLCTDDARPLRGEPDLTDALMVAQFVRPVRWSRIARSLLAFPGLDLVLDLGPGDGVARLTRSVLRGEGVTVLPLSPAPSSGAQERSLLHEGQAPLPPALRYADFAPQLVAGPQGRVVVDNRYTRATGQPPVILPGMTPTTVEVPIVAAAANAGFTAELAGGGQVSEEIFWARMRELSTTLEPGREVVFNALFLDPYLWDLHVRRAGLVLKARKLGYPVAGLTISAGVPEVDEAVRLLGQLREAGLFLNAFKPGTLPQIEAVCRIASAAPDHTIFLHLEGGRAGGHHSWEDLEQLLLDGYASIRERPNLVLCVGGGIGDPARAVELLTGTWALRHGLGIMPVDAVFLGTLAMATKEAMTSPSVKAALVAAKGHVGWVYQGEQKGGVTSGKSQLDADIHYLDNTASRVGRLLDEVAGDADRIAARKVEIVAALNHTAKPYFGDLEEMTWASVLQRASTLMAVGRGTAYEDGPWPDRSYRERIVDLYARAEARLVAQDRGSFVSALGPDGGRAALDQPAATLAAFLAAYPAAETMKLTASDARHIVRRIWARPGKPVNFVPVIDGDVRRWYKSDALWQAHDPRLPADAVLVIPGPDALAGLDRADEPVASLLGRFNDALIAHLGGGAHATRARLRQPMLRAEWPQGVRCLSSTTDQELSIQAEIPAAAWRDAVRGQISPALAPLLDERWFVGARSISNPLWDLLRPEPGASLLLRADLLRYSPAGRPDEALILELTPTGWHMAVRATARFELPLVRIPPAAAGLDPAVGLDPAGHRGAVRSYYLGALFGQDAPPRPLFDEAVAEVSLEATSAAAYGAVVGAVAGQPPLELAFSLLWRPLFEVLAAAEIAGGLLRLVHLENRVEAGPCWPPAAGQPLVARARVTRVEEGEGGRVVETRGSLSGEDGLCAAITSRFYIKRSPIDGEMPELRSWERLTKTLRLGAVEREVLLGQGWVRPDGQAPLPAGEGEAQVDVWLGEHRERGKTRARAEGWLVLDGARYAVQLDEVRSGGHPVRDLLAALDPGEGPKVHEHARHGLGEALTQAPAELRTFAEVGGDHNPIHQRVLAARLAGLPGPIVHGMWSSARLHAHALVAAHAPPARTREVSAAFFEPVLPGEALRLDAARVGRVAGDALVDATASVQRGEDWRPAARVRCRLAPPRTAWVFPGQGVQKPGMGMDTLARSPAARAIWETADAHARVKLGFSILDVVRDNPRELIVHGERLTHPQGLLHLTAFTQVALAVLASAQVAELREQGVLPVGLQEGMVTAGHSLGEYNALCALAGVVPLEAVVEVVYARGEAMHRLVPRDAKGESGYRMGVLRPGAVGLAHEQCEAVVAEVAASTGGFLQIVNYNVRGKQYAVVGDIGALDALERRLNVGNSRGLVPVPGIDVPFHSRVLWGGVPEFRGVLRRVLPVDAPYMSLVGRYIPNLLARPFSTEPAFADALAELTGTRVGLERREDWTAGRIDDTTYARELVIELLAWQFASPVRWIETTEVLLRPRDEGGLGVERVVEVGPGHQPTLANMTRQALHGSRLGARAIAVYNAEADRQSLLGEDGGEAPKAAKAAPRATKAAPKADAPKVEAPRAAAPAAGPPADRAATVAEGVKALLALHAKVRPEQIRDDETVDGLFDGVSSRRNQVLMDLGAEFQAGSIDGAHERPIGALVAEVARRAPAWKLPGPFLRAAGDEGLKRALGRAGWGRKELAEALTARFGFGPGLVEGAILALALGSRDGESGRGGALHEAGLEAPTDKAGAARVAEKLAAGLAARHGFALPSAEAEGGGAVADPAALRALEERVFGPEGPLLRAAEALAESVGRKLVSVENPELLGLPAEDPTAAALRLVEAEHGKEYTKLIAPIFDAGRHVAFEGAGVWARRDVARLAWRWMRAPDADLGVAAARLARFAGDGAVVDTARWYAGRARRRGQEAVAARLEAIGAGVWSGGVGFVPSTPQVEVSAEGTRAWDVPWAGGDAGARWIDGLEDGMLTGGGGGSGQPLPSSSPLPPFGGPPPHRGGGVQWESHQTPPLATAGGGGPAGAGGGSALPLPASPPLPPFGGPPPAGAGGGVRGELQQTPPLATAGGGGPAGAGGGSALPLPASPPLPPFGGPPPAGAGGGVRGELRQTPPLATAGGGGPAGAGGGSALPLPASPPLPPFGGPPPAGAGGGVRGELQQTPPLASAGGGGPAGAGGGHAPPPPSLDAIYRQVLNSALPAPLSFAGRTALVTGASPGSIALALVQHLLAGGARVVLTTSTYSADRLRFYREFYQTHAGPGAELHVVPYNQASLQDADALLDWMLRPLAETNGGTTKALKGPWTPDLIVPFAALKDLGYTSALDGRSHAALRALLLGVERLVAGLGARLIRQGMPGRPCQVLLPLSPNHGVFGGDGLYAEGKAALEALLHKVRSEASAWGRAIALTGARIGWVRGTGLMDAHDAVAARLEALGMRTFSTEEMALLLAGLCVDPLRQAAEPAPLIAALTGGFDRIPDVGEAVRQAREGLLAEVAAARRRKALVETLAPPAPAVARKALPVPAAAPTPVALEWPAAPALRDMVVIVGAGELGPWGSARTRHEIEVDGRLSAAGVLELAWMTGLVRFQDDARGGGWVDGASGEPVAEEDIADRYEAEVMKRAGLRTVDPATAGFDPQALPVMAPIYLDRELRFPVASAEEAQSFVAEDPEHTTVLRDPASGELHVVRAAGSVIRVPRRFRLKRTVAGLLPDGFDPVRYGIPKDMAERVDRVALINLVATVDAFLSAGLSPEALLARVHPARVANTQGGGIGGMVSLRRLFTDLLVGQERQPDALQETLINVVAAHVVQSYVGSYGAMAHPVGACASAAVSLEEAQDKILSGRAEFVVAGGFDDFGPAGAVGFQDMAATADSDAALAAGIGPRALSRPGDRRRRGFVEAQGGGTVLLARGDVALALGLPVLGVLGWAGTFGDGVHRSIPAPGLGLVAAALGGAQSPLGSALGAYGLSTDDVAVVYKHDTSTNANDYNEARIHHVIQGALGRTPGNPLWVVSQKAITGHAKGGSAAWQTIGLLQTLREGRIGGNPNLDTLDEAIRSYTHLGYTDTALQPVEPLRAGLLTSLGFGHVNAIALLLHPDAFRAALTPEQRLTWDQAVQGKAAEAARAWSAAQLGATPAYRRPPDRRFDEADHGEAEIAMLLDPDARLVGGRFRAGAP